ncbi:AraC family transcriptional regulator [Pseudoalteromonas sp. PS5]|uniref:helix-turn-helix domain-containing protein n=1 Tax=Pseudoalteromonas sp. PS5 TaxID=1437473 RepID=UPI000FFF5362|nr:AraC family transcriptional regulator [Pseudoalteromonas sp. PS5]RXE99018.1 AraC family transcriptional regulator [Pseudoalteromonas sp. PS5]
MADPIVIVLSAMLVGQVVLSVPVLLSHQRTRTFRLPLVLFLSACGVLAMNTLVQTFLPTWYQAYTVFGFVMLFVLCPAMRLYIEGITTVDSWTLHRSQLRAFLLLWPAMLVAAMIAVLPPEQHHALFVKNEEPSARFSILLAVSMLLLICMWLIECAYTLIIITKRLFVFNAHIKGYYSNLDNHHFYAAKRLVFALICIWIFVLFITFLSNLLGQAILTLRLEVFTALVLIWCVTFFAMQQKQRLLLPLEFQTAGTLQGTDGTIVNELDNKKYAKSALGAAQSKRIVSKINEAMQDQALFLDPNLTLQKLAQATGVSPNYLSQTLNETLGVSFFDFVNQWRIEASKSHLLSSKSSVLNIALEVGFNARSSFYKAFKKETGMTPKAFRQKNTEHRRV